MLSVSCGGCFIAKSGLTAVTPVDYILPSSSVHGILQARILEWVAISFSRGSSQPRDLTHVSFIAVCTSCRTAQMNPESENVSSSVMFYSLKPPRL